jgi:hypothetical protein
MRFRLLVAAAATLSTVALAPTAASAPAPSARDAARAGSVIALGQSASGSEPCPSAGMTSVQSQVSSGGPSYVTPGAGVITSVSYFANGVPGHIRLVFLKPGAVVGTYTSIGYTSPFTVTASTLNTFPVRTKVGAGVTLGLYVDTAGMGCGSSGFGLTDSRASGVFDPVTGSDFLPITSNNLQRLDLAVTMEPDADNDGYGDVTQDLCPTSDLTHNSCDNVTVPDTKLKRKPARHGTKRKIKATFTSTVAGSTFECSLDQQPFKACTSPYRKKVGYGKHILKVQAVGPAGLVDPSPASRKFTVTRRK